MRSLLLKLTLSGLVAPPAASQTPVHLHGCSGLQLTNAIAPSNFQTVSLRSLGCKTVKILCNTNSLKTSYR
jgi:hypothetical protein